jgi:hypothetical protein
MAWANDILVVVAAGNSGLDGVTLDQRTPQNLGRADNPLITVGGIQFGGEYWPNTIPAKPGMPGSMTLHAQSVDVNCASNTGTEAKDTHIDSGTSFAAPAVVRDFLNLVNFE